jgi:hypothetical protein
LGSIGSAFVKARDGACDFSRFHVPQAYYQQPAQPGPPAHHSAKPRQGERYSLLHHAEQYLQQDSAGAARATRPQQYATGKAIDGLPMLIAQEEANIRENLMARTMALLKKVFGG